MAKRQKKPERASEIRPTESTKQGKLFEFRHTDEGIELAASIVKALEGLNSVPGHFSERVIKELKQEFDLEEPPD